MRGLDWYASVWYFTGLDVRDHPGGNNSVVECDLAKVEVAGSNPVSRSNFEAPRILGAACSATWGPIAHSAPHACFIRSLGVVRTL